MEILKQKKKISLQPAQLIFIYYFIAVVVSTILLMLPITLKPNVHLTLIDALFTAVSAVSVTGLSTITINEVLSVPGTFIFALILQFGGIGIMFLGTTIWLLIGRRIGIKDRMLIMTDQNLPTFSGLVKLVRNILFLFIIMELVAAIIFGTYFLKYFPTWQEAYLQGFFASVSAATNAGFDITGESLIPFSHDYFVLIMTMVLLIIGAIGFPVLMEVIQFFKHRKKTPYRFSLFTKITTLTFFALIVVGTILIYGCEYNRFFADKSWHESFFNSLFYSVSSRNGGLNTIDINEYSPPTLFILSILMFIGTSPSSAGGGIRTTTFAIMILSIYYFANGTTTIKIFRKEIAMEDVIKSFIVITTAMMLCCISTVILSILEPNFSLLEIIFEVSSAFGTVGLSMGITAKLSVMGKVVIMILMFIGRIGIFTFLLIMGGKPLKTNYHYPKERIIIG
ncbi:TrkH family potassium uptake protein [Bacillus salipaludis]|uniref:TrkH family potassium uptake protein n=1 Tax=Bacillus salipaludis TaxID=2547811 RepID=A0A4V3AT06_9BACI|nr:TrkH family potassium uptake protein [Bacillus salipaludis]MDQ6597739.1 TrkH family potassium uptake protein [Bacillus salipaludis]TDK56342.1 TrkH family potassium uptake protein [Bacillus salipaludis]